ncbi:Aste57867_8688 [Aphanomyces stellatus]|uniref:Aste57867_8688 protein n=1 Tax=Aphanomyces stellatus TaxID=120398 RepID=A0A485KKX0_9STRA|nr:hypothetical protein As57867_008654 [Aphanomyces stellatus]VFT85574.1 Aste57867_8688 [Aphanomyces stellatus]
MDFISRFAASCRGRSRYRRRRRRRSFVVALEIVCLGSAAVPILTEIAIACTTTDKQVAPTPHKKKKTTPQDLPITAPTTMEWIEIVKDLNAGTVGGVAGIVAGHPLDTIKVKLQTQSHTNRMGFLASCRQLAASEGVKGFYKGMLSPIISNAPINAVVFAVYGQMSRVLEGGNDGGKLTPGQQLIAGAAAGLFQVSFAAPAELVKITMQVNNYPSNYSSISCLRDILKAEGMRGIYRGTGLQIMRDVPAFGSYFYSYEVLKSTLTDGQPDNETTMNLLMAGGLAGSISWVCTQPIDVVKTLVQSQPAHGRLSTLDLMRHHYKLEGPRFLLKGFGATVLRAFPVSAVTFLVYERTMQYMNQAEYDVLLQ